jgi:predicted small metal-binding protein
MKEPAKEAAKTDIVKHLRDHCPDIGCGCAWSMAADEIERLRSALHNCEIDAIHYRDAFNRACKERDEFKHQLTSYAIKPWEPCKLWRPEWGDQQP